MRDNSCRGQGNSRIFIHKPQDPFSLGGLLRDYEPSVAEEKSAAAVSASPSFDFGDDLGGFRQVEELSVPGAPSLNPDEGEEDYSLLDLSDEELELLIDKEPAGGAEKRPDLWMDLDSDKKASDPDHPVRSRNIPRKLGSGEPGPLDDLIPRFDFSSLPGLAEKTPLDAPPEPEFVWAEPKEKPQAPHAAPEETAIPPEIEAAAQPRENDRPAE